MKNKQIRDYYIIQYHSPSDESYEVFNKNKEMVGRITRNGRFVYAESFFPLLEEIFRVKMVCRPDDFLFQYEKGKIFIKVIMAINKHQNRKIKKRNKQK